MITERELELEDQQFRYRRRRLRQAFFSALLASVAVGVIVLALLGNLPSVSVSAKPTVTPPKDALFINSGLARSPLTRTKAVTYTEPTTREGAAGSEVPAIVTASLEGDLQDSSTKEQFPGTAVQLSASPSGPGRLQLTVIIDPSQGEDTSGGTYTGTVAVLTGSDVIRVPLLLYLAPRDGTPAVAAFLLLIIGATVGLGVKWITESLSRLATARWRLEDLRRGMGNDPARLPLMAAVQLEEIDERIRRQDTDDLDKAFAPLLSNRLHLRSFVTAVRTAENEIDQQRSLADDLDSSLNPALDGLDADFVESIARAEATRVDGFRALDWPWDDPEIVVSRVQELAEQCRTATNALSDATSGRATTTTLGVLELFRRGRFENAVALYGEPADRLVVESPPDGTKGSTARPLRRRRFAVDPEVVFMRLRGSGQAGIVSWMAQRPRWFAAAASVLVVSLVGLQLQYLDVQEFTGELGDWLGLFLWAAIVELSGVSVLDVLSRLGGGTASGGGSVRGAPSRGSSGSGQ